MKRYLSLLCACVMCLLSTGCVDDDNNSNGNTDDYELIAYDNNADNNAT